MFFPHIAVSIVKVQLKRIVSTKDIQYNILHLYTCSEFNMRNTILYAQRVFFLT